MAATITLRRCLVLTALLALSAAVGCVHVPINPCVIPLRVMTYNIRSGNGDLAATAQVIRASAPDLVGLQEVDVHWAERSNFADQVTELGAMLGMHVRFAPIYQLPSTPGGDPPREFGVALLSKFPISAWRNDTITRLSTQQSNPIPAPMPGLLNATVDIHGTAVRVFNTHLDYRSDPAVRVQQVKEMLNYVGDSPLPTILFGDLNATPDAPELQPLLQRLRDSWPTTSGEGLTYPADAPRKRIDYVLSSRHFQVGAAEVGNTLASDHRPVLVELRLTPRQQPKSHLDR